MLAVMAVIQAVVG